MSNRRKKPEKLAPLDWDQAIADAKAEIERLRRRISVLEGGIHVFAERKKSGDVFPAEPSATWR